MVGKILTEITEQNFDDEVLKSDLPVFACFITSWCQSCYPTLLVADTVAEKYDGKIKFVKVDIERSPKISDRYHIVALPTIIIFRDSQPVKRLLGFQDRWSLRDLLGIMIAEEELSRV